MNIILYIIAVATVMQVAIFSLLGSLWWVGLVIGLVVALGFGACAKEE